MKIELVYTKEDIAAALVAHAKSEGYDVATDGAVNFTVTQGDPRDPREPHGASISARVTATKRPYSQR